MVVTVNSTKDELLAEMEARGGRGCWTDEERAILHGKVASSLEKTNARNEELVRRLKAGEYLSRADKKEARQLVFGTPHTSQ